MVSVYPNPPPGQDFTHLYCFYSGGGGDTMKNGVHIDLPETSSGWNASLGMEDTNKKIRKPYTITKSRESWSEQEHDKFLEALQLFDRDWKKIEAFVGSKTVIQIRSHAQKYFMKVLKNGKSEHVPPPRPKRKAAHPYPQKAPKNGFCFLHFLCNSWIFCRMSCRLPISIACTFMLIYAVMSQATGVLQSSAVQLESGYTLRPESLCVNRNPVGSVHSSPWTSTDHVSHISKDDIGLAGGTMMQYYSHNRNESNAQPQRSNETNCQVKAKQCTATKVMPDFTQVYSFLGSVFDHSASDHLQRLKRMDPINVGTVLMLMKNLSINLVSPEFEDHRRLLSSYDVGSENDSMGSTIQSA